MTAASPAVPAQVEVLPSGFALPPLPYLLALVVALAAVGGALYRRDPQVTPRVVLGLAPWMVAGATLYALFQVGAIPGPLAPLFGSPAVYLTTFVAAGVVWVASADLPADGWSPPSVAAVLLAAGGAVALLAVGLALAVGAARPGGLSLFWPLVGLLGSLALAGAVWAALRRAIPAVARTGAAGALVVFGHALDGVSTAIGTDVYGFGEQTPLSRAIIEFAAALPTAGPLGAGWLFVLVKVVVAAAVVYALVEYVEARPREGLVVLALVAAVGLGPGTHNLVLFAIA